MEIRSLSFCSQYNISFVIYFDNKAVFEICKFLFDSLLISTYFEWSWLRVCVFLQDPMFHLSWTNLISVFYACQPFGNSASNSLWALLFCLWFIFSYLILPQILKEQVYKDGQYIQLKYPLDSMLRSYWWVFVGCNGVSWFSRLRVICSMLQLLQWWTSLGSLTHFSAIISKLLLVGSLHLQLGLIKVYNESVSMTTRPWVGFISDSRKTVLFTPVSRLALGPTQLLIQLVLEVKAAGLWSWLLTSIYYCCN
jgi:hypothetical protein